MSRELFNWDSGKSAGISDHGELEGLGDDDHSQYLNEARHDKTERHTLGDVVPHDTTKVGLSGNETIAGVKTFSSIPVLPASDPTTDNQAVRKAYADIRRMLVRVVPHDVALTTGYLTYIPIFENMHLLDVECMIWTSSTSGLPQIGLLIGANDILSTNLFINQGEHWSFTATTRKVINPAYDDFGVGAISVYCQDAGVGTKGLDIWFKVQLL